MVNRYAIDFHRLVNSLVPHFMGGRKLILLLQSLVSPLKAVNTTFVQWAREYRLTALTNAQCMRLDYYLRHRLGDFVANTGEPFEFVHPRPSAVILYSMTLDTAPKTVMYGNDETGGNGVVFKKRGEILDSENGSFIVKAPAVKTDAPETEYLNRIRNIIDTYRVAGKTFDIQIKQS